PSEVNPPSLLKAAPTSVTRGSYELVIHDDLDGDMTFSSISSVTANGKPLDPSLYTVAGTSGAGAEFTITMDLVQLYENGYYTLEEIDDCPEIVVTYTAVMSSTASAGVKTNSAWVSYESGKTSNPSDVTVIMYGIDVFKYDQADNSALPDAEFTLTGNGATYTGKSDQNGHVVFDGLAAGTYTLTETKAPGDYVKSDTPIEVNVEEKADKTTYIAHVEFANVAYPHTGGQALLEILPYLIPGAIVVIGGVIGIVTVVVKKKKSAGSSAKD
nr:prealbumin-like fold domain-containing protein [Clostridiales bacterium]